MTGTLTGVVRSTMTNVKYVCDGPCLTFEGGAMGRTVGWQAGALGVMGLLGSVLLLVV